MEGSCHFYLKINGMGQKQFQYNNDDEKDVHFLAKFSWNFNLPGEKNTIKIQLNSVYQGSGQS